MVVSLGRCKRRYKTTLQLPQDGAGKSVSVSVSVSL